MIPNLVVDWGPELRPTMLALTLGALLPGVLAVVASLLRRAVHARAGAGATRDAQENVARGNVALVVPRGAP